MKGHARHHHRLERRHAAPGPDLRVDDGDREGTVEVLRAHASVGRLDVDELEERTASALVARTGRELRALTEDLPRLPADSARRRAAWRAEVTTYLVVVLGLVAVWLATGAAHPWPLYPALGWGVPLLLGRPRQARTRRRATTYVAAHTTPATRSS